VLQFLLCSFISASLASADSQTEIHRTWSRTISIEPANSENRAHQFVLYDVDQSESRLVGTWWYENGALGNQIPRRVEIEGTRTPDGVFWPDVTLQVKNELTRTWETVATPHSEGTRTTVTIEPNGRNSDLTVNLNVFKPLIQAHKLGRILLKTGEASEFELKYLLPPDKRKDENLNRFDAGDYNLFRYCHNRSADEYK
jgi:hypothetical protein